MPPTHENDTTKLIRSNLENVRQAVRLACDKAGRDADTVTILPISKKQPLDVISAALALDLSTFGENYVEEAAKKQENLLALGEIAARWEMVGHLQSRKAGVAAALFSRVHSVDSVKIARLLNSKRPAGMAPLEVLLQVNLSGEESKSGISAIGQASWPELLPLIEEISTMENLILTGLMAMPPFPEHPEDNRGFYAELRALLGFLNSQLPGLNLSHLSMGTSGDYVTAIEEGATIVRLGESIFGPRPT